MSKFLSDNFKIFFILFFNWEMLLNFSFDKDSFDFAGEFPTTSSKHVEGTHWYRGVQSEHDNLGEERAQNDELTWPYSQQQDFSRAQHTIEGRNPNFNKVPESFVSEIHGIMIFLLLLASLPQTLIK